MGLYVRPQPFKFKYSLLCANPPTQLELDHLAHLLWHLRNENIHCLETTLHGFEWLERNLSTPLTEVEYLRLKVSSFMFEGDKVKPWVDSLLFDRPGCLVQARRGVNFNLSKLDEEHGGHKRVRFCSVVQHFVRIFSTSPCIPKDLYLSDGLRWVNQYHWHEVISNETNGTKFAVTGRFGGVLLRRYDQVAQFLCNNHRHEFWLIPDGGRREYWMQKRWSDCCEGDSAAKRALDEHKIVHLKGSKCNFLFCPLRY